MARMTVIKNGFFMTIQDLGRFTSRDYGVPHSGAMDQLSSRMANELLSNPEDTAVIEMTLKGGTFIFSEPTRIAITGAVCSIQIHETIKTSPCVIDLKTGDILEIGAALNGNFIYMAIAGGFQVESYLGSRSYYPYILDSSLIEKGVHISYDSSLQSTTNEPRPLSFKGSLKAFRGPEFKLLSRRHQEQLLSQSFTVSKNWNRMAFQLSELIENDLKPIKSSPVLPGTIQLTPEGKLIVLMRDAQTTGGYPRVLQLDETSISLISQQTIGCEVDFVIA